MKNNEWISVKDDLPYAPHDVLLRVNLPNLKTGACLVGSYDKESKQWSSYPLTDIEVTHWMPLPEAPKY